jgi:hypothetical protein
MSKNYVLYAPAASLQGEKKLKKLFGEEAILSRVGRFQLIHLDCPDPAEVQKRIDEFDPAQLLEQDCPLCEEMRREGGTVVFEQPSCEP